MVELNGTFSLDVLTHQARDMTVEGMLRITGIPRNFPLHELMLDLEPIFTDWWMSIFGPAPRYWFYLAFHYTAPEGIKSADVRYRGVSVARTNASRCIPGKFPVPFLGAKRIIANLIRKRRLKPIAVCLWVYWSGVGGHPDKTRPEIPIKRKKTPL